MDKLFSYSNLVKKFKPSLFWLSTSTANHLKKNINAHKVLTEEFTPEELAEFYDVLGTQLSIPQGKVIFHENDEADAFYIILNGEAEVYINTHHHLHGLHSHVLATLKKDDVIGDMALIENKPRSASLRAKSDLSVLSFKLLEVRKHPHITLLLTRNMAKMLSEKIRYTNQITVKKMEESLEQAEARNVLGVFMVAMFWLISLYTISLTSLIDMGKHLANNTFLSVGLIFFFALGTLSAMRLTGLPLKHFGITLQDWPKKIVQALIYSLPIMMLFVLIKAYLVYFGANPQHVAVFSGFSEGIVDGTFSWQFYLMLIFLYTLFSPIQELIARCALQSTFFSFLPGNEMFRKWNAILLSNLIFSSVHSHLSLMFATLTFIPGLYWGWLFYKQHSFIGVSIAHIVVGVWGVFIIGAKGIIY
ncbi:cyclic nucleotide-binding domain-containing protein [Legionella drancourtii]|uniref:CAAX amino terminal protease family protein n=1 Tax=Legionella drancourtii LLAP12 TaxID=658187 RepID=G9EUT9_9GAMM|nr:cyclic nucleotide-binding domain-containing protein [Legionella drancourtii]EHL29089.1 CAAX amino terminal protease family protein [Legionella drancourtii LLAP12]